jgi:hypothetical protein
MLQVYVVEAARAIGLFGSLGALLFGLRVLMG